MASIDLFDRSAYAYNSQALSGSQQVQLYQQLVHHQLLASVPSPAALGCMPWGAAFPGAPWSHFSSPFGAAHWGGMPAWPQTGAAQVNSCWAPPAPSLALNPLPHDVLASLQQHPAAPATPACNATPVPSPTAAATACMTSSSNQNNCNGTALLGSTGAVAAAAATDANLAPSPDGACVPMVAAGDDEDLCDDLFRMFAEEDLAAAPVTAPGVDAAALKAANQELLSSIMSNDASEHTCAANNLNHLQPQQPAAARPASTNASTGTGSPTHAALPMVPAAVAAYPPPALLPTYPPTPMPTSSSSATSTGGMLLPTPPTPTTTFCGMPHPHLAHPHPAYTPSYTPAAYTSTTVFSASQAFPSRSPTPPAAATPSPIIRAGSMPTPTSSGSNQHTKGGVHGGSNKSNATSGGVKACGVLNLHAVHSGGVRKPSSPSSPASSALAGSGRQASSTLAVSGAAAAGLLEADLLLAQHATRAKSPLGPAAVGIGASGIGAVVVEGLGGSCPGVDAQPLQQQPKQQQQQEELNVLLLCGAAGDAAEEVLDCCDNLSHTLDWMDVLPGLA